MLARWYHHRHSSPATQHLGTTSFRVIAGDTIHLDRNRPAPAGLRPNARPVRYRPTCLRIRTGRVHHENCIDRGRPCSIWDGPVPACPRVARAGTGPARAGEGRRAHGRRGGDHRARRGVHEGLQRRRRGGGGGDVYRERSGRRRGGRPDRGPRGHQGPARAGLRGESRHHDRHQGRRPPFPWPRDGARGGPNGHHAARRGGGARDDPVHRRLRQERRQVAPVRRPRRASRTTSRPTTGSRSWSGSSATGSTRARTRSSRPRASGPRTATSWSATSR